ncbi:alanine racemase [Microbacterium sp. SSW1-59]|uniref:alanine racemase n=1 Tax=Microbacterium xanthum TaxID=3079794 RepID=UPI002AD49100|nr:alanine racemase [Microbacterium sp. SSW1-59]MDZ8202222.1 alanine racemase [Microbacterium sp. SSW1-59]
MIELLAREPVDQTGRDPDEFWWRIDAAVADFSGPLAVIDVGALRHNALDLLVRAGGVPIRVASKSVRVRAVLDAVLALPGYAGILAYTLPEALWLAETHEDIVVGYPTADRAALAHLAADESAARRVTLMVDDIAQLDLLDAVAPPSVRAEVRVAIDADASWRSAALGHVGVRRSPLHDAADVTRLARAIAARPGVRLVGLMMYEAQVAGQPDAVGPEAPLMRWMKRRSIAELHDRRAGIVSALRDVAALEFVNGGGTGSLEATSADRSVTELTAGSGLLAGHVFDGYRGFAPAPASAFSLEVVRRPTADIVTVLGGGWVGSGPPAASRQPRPVWPAPLRTLTREGAGEVQTPLQGRAASTLAIGDRVWFRHAKSGETAEHVDRYLVVDGGAVIGEVPTYRGEGKAFL